MVPRRPWLSDQWYFQHGECIFSLTQLIESCGAVPSVHPLIHMEGLLSLENAPGKLQIA